MVEIQTWCQTYCAAVEQVFGSRVRFIGLQGSYARGEATDHSDIDPVLIVDQLEPDDLQRYSHILDQLPHRALICGFVAGQRELLAWEPAELFQFYFDTTPLRGTLDHLRHLIDDAAIDRAIRIGAGNLYHGCVHNMLHEKSRETLRQLYKAAIFLMQAVCYRQSGQYARTRAALQTAAGPTEQKILQAQQQLCRDPAADFWQLSALLFSWSKQFLQEASHA